MWRRQKLVDGSPDLRTLEVKVTLLALWMALGFTLTLVFTLQDFDPGSNGLTHTLLTLPPQQLSWVLLGDATIRLIPFVLAILSLTLKERWSRWMNLALGLVFSIFAFSGLATLLLSQPSMSNAYLLVTQVATIAAAVLVFWCAYSWPKQVTHGSPPKTRASVWSSRSAFLSGGGFHGGVVLSRL